METRPVEAPQGHDRRNSIRSFGAAGSLGGRGSPLWRARDPLFHSDLPSGAAPGSEGLGTSRCLRHSFELLGFEALVTVSGCGSSVRRGVGALPTAAARISSCRMCAASTDRAAEGLSRVAHHSGSLKDLGSCK